MTMLDDQILDPAKPLATANALLIDTQTAEDAQGGGGQTTIRFYRGLFYRWTGTYWAEWEEQEVRRTVYHFCESRERWAGRGREKEAVAFDPTRAHVNDIIDALKAQTVLSQNFEPPCWLNHRDQPPPASEFMVCSNAMIHLPSFVDGDTCEYPHSPYFFNFNCLPYAFNRAAPPPTAWLAFLSSLWPDDADSVALLQEWFGYCLTSSTRHQKIMLLYGPQRSGKGTIVKTLEGLLGKANLGSQTCGGLTTNFGLCPLIGKAVCVIPDARLSGRTDAAVIIERLLSISGEDPLTIDRKHLPPLTLKLPTRLMMVTNELPKLPDASGALASRFLILRLTRSWLRNEDLGLMDKILPEIPSILLWAIEGWKRLRTVARFAAPQSAEQSVQELEEVNSPVQTFVRECCTLKPAATTDCMDLYKKWVEWCTEQGREHPGTVQNFGRDLAAACPTVRVVRQRRFGMRARLYEGISIGAEIPPYDGEQL